MYIPFKYTVGLKTPTWYERASVQWRLVGSVPFDYVLQTGRHANMGEAGNSSYPDLNN